MAARGDGLKNVGYHRARGGLRSPFAVSGFRVFHLSASTPSPSGPRNILTGYNGASPRPRALRHRRLYHGHQRSTAGVSAAERSRASTRGSFRRPPALRLEGLYLARHLLPFLALPQLLKYSSTGRGIAGIVPPSPRLRGQTRISGFISSPLPTLFFRRRVEYPPRIPAAPVATRYKFKKPVNHGDLQRARQSVVFGVSAAYTGVAGALSAIAIAFVAPDSFDVFLSVTLLTGIVIGGLATISGAIFGAIFILFVPNWALDISKAAPWAIFGISLIVFMYVMPRGIAGSLRLLWIRMTRPAVTARKAE